MAQAATANLIVNPGFETGDLSSWSVSDAGKVSVVNTVYYSGAYSLEVKGDGNYPYARQMPIAVDANTDYQLSFYAKADSASTSYEYRTATSDSANVAIKVATKDNAPTEWTKYELDFNSGSNTSIRTVVKATKLAYFDDFKLVKAADAGAIELPDGANVIAPNNAAIKYFGRWDQSDPAQYTTSWGGTYFKVNFTGTQVKLLVKNSVNLYAKIDGQESYFASANGIVDLTPAPLAEGTHTLMIATPYTDQELNFRGIWLDDGAQISVPQVGSKTIEFTGGSIVAGYLLPKQALSDFAWLAPEMLGYEHTQIAHTGINLVDQWSGGSYVASKAGLSKQYFKLKNADSAVTTDWNFGTYQPDAVVINVGTNDSKFAVPSDTYQAAYTKFLTDIRAEYPNAELYAQRLFNGAYAQETLNSVNALNQAGDARVHYIDTTGWLTDSEFIDGTHPTAAAHQKLAVKFAAILGHYPAVKASHAAIAGTAKLGETLTGSYDYANDNGTAEGGSQFRWLLSNTESGPYLPIDGATGKTLTLTRAHSSSYIKFEVTPVDATGKFGDAVQSDPAPVEAATAAPSVFTNFITASGDKLMDGNSVFRFASLNYPGGMRDSEFSQEDAIRTIAAIGGQVTRTYVPPVKRYDNANASYALVLGPDANGVMQFNEAGFRKLDNLLALANEHGVRLVIPFVDQWQWEGGIESYVNFRYPGTISNDAAHDDDAWKFYTDPLVISDFKQVIHYVMNRTNTITGVKYKEDKAILAWETGNELGGYNQDKFPQSWTTEIAKYIKEQEKPEQLLLDGRFAINSASLTDANIDIVGNHFYTGNFLDKVNSDSALAAGKKPYMLGEFGLYTSAAPVDSLYKAALQNGTDGVMIWSLRPHKEDGGFFWHDEDPGNWASYHWPGFSSGDYYGEKDIIRTVYKYAHYMKANDTAMATAVPAILAPENAPKLFAINSVADIRWQGSVGASGYEVQRKVAGGSDWVTIAANFSDGGRAGTPAFHDEKALSGESYTYRVRGVNESGTSPWSNEVTTTAAHVITDELSLLYKDAEKRNVYAYDHSTNVQTSSPDGNELGIGYKAFVSTANPGYLTYASPVPLSEISMTASGTGKVRWYVSSTNSHYQEIKPTASGSVWTAGNLPADTRYVKFSIPGSNAVQVDNVKLTYVYNGTGYQSIPALTRNGFIVDTGFGDKTDSKSSNLTVKEGKLSRTGGEAGEVVYRVDGDINSYRFTAYANSDAALTFYASMDGDTYAKVNPAAAKTAQSDGWSKVIYSDFALPASTRYLKAVYPATASGESPAIGQTEIGFGTNMIPLTDKPPASVFEDGEYDYGVDANIEARYTRNAQGDAISIGLDPVNKNRGSYGVKLDYAFSSQYYAGLTRALEGADLSQFDVLHAWVKPDGSNNKLSFQLKTGDGRVWEAPLTLAGTTAKTVEIKLSDFVQPQWNKDAVGSGTLNLGSVKEFTLIVSSGGSAAVTNAGTVYLDDIKLANAAKLDNFEGYGGYNALLQKAFARNTGGGSFDVSLDSKHKSEGGYGLRVDYNYAGPGYAGGSLNPDYLNLKGYDGFTFWFQPDGSNNSLAIQFTDANGKYWETSVVFKGSEPRLMYVPFDSFRYPSWYGSDENARPDSNVNITAFSLYVGSTSQSTSASGTLYIDDINGAKFKDALAAGSVKIDNAETDVQSLPLTLHGTASGVAFIELTAGKQTFYAPVGSDGKWSYTTSKVANGTKEVSASIALFDGTAIHTDTHTFEVNVPNNPFDDGDPKPQKNYLANGGFEEVVDAAAWPILPTHWTHADATGKAVTDGTVKLETSGTRSGTYRLVHWNASAFEVTSSQEVSDLPDGIYELRAWTMSKGGQAAAEMTATVGGTTKSVSLPTGTSSWAYVKLSDLEVKDGKLTAAFHSKDLGGNWIAVDDVELVQTTDLSQPPEAVKVTGVTLDHSTLKLKVGGTVQLTATVTPADAADKSVIWTSSNEQAASVSQTGLVTALATGTSKISVTTVDGAFKANAEVTVIAADGNENGNGNGNGNGNENGNGNGNGNAGSGSGGDGSNNSITIKPTIENGAAIAQAAAGQTEVAVALSDIGNYPLLARTEAVSVKVSEAVIKQLNKQASELGGAIIKVSAKPIMGLSANEAAGEHLLGQALDITVSLVTQDGKVFKAEQVDGGIEITLSYAKSGTDVELLGIYFYNEGTKAWEYIGGRADAASSTITATLTHLSKYAVLEWKKSFADVPSSHWAARKLQVLTARHVVDGTGAGRFTPSGWTTRAEFTAMLVRALKLPDSAASGSVAFKDLSTEAWYTSAVSAAANAGWVQGDEQGRFNPNAPITRAEMIVILARAMNSDLSSQAALQPVFVDASSIPVWALPSVSEALKHGWIEGRGAGKLEPLAYATRAETASLLYNVLISER